MKRLINRILIFTLLAITSACAEKEWSKSEKDKVYDQCRQEGGSRSYCNCYLNNVMEKFHDPDELEEVDFETAYELSLNCE